MLNLNTISPSISIYSAPGDKGQIVYFPKMHCFFGPRKVRGPKIFHPPGHSTITQTLVQLHKRSLARVSVEVNPGLNCMSITKYVMNIPII